VGQGFGRNTLRKPVNEMWLSANLAFVMFQAWRKWLGEFSLKFASELYRLFIYLNTFPVMDGGNGKLNRNPAQWKDQNWGALTTTALAKTMVTIRSKGRRFLITYGDHEFDR